jgi:hypothetical protein
VIERWSYYPVGQPDLSMPGHSRGHDPELGSYWEHTVEVRQEVSRHGAWRVERLMRYYDRDGMVESVRREWGQRFWR